MLKPEDWVGVKAGAIKQTLLGTPENSELVVGFGYDIPTNFVFLMPSDLEGKDPNGILKDAYKNLENFKQDFEISNALNGKILTASGQADKELLNTFVVLHKNAQEDESYGNATILNAMFVVKEGEINGIISLNK